MAMEEKANGVLHNLILENREKITISGVEDVDSFDDNSIIIQTQMGLLTLVGSDLHIVKFNVDTGELSIEGEIDEMVYSDEGRYTKKGGFFSKMFG